MTVVVWGDPLSCRYAGIEPRELAGHADVVGHVASKVGATVAGLEAVAGLSESVFAGATAEAVRSRAGRRAEEATALRSSFDEVSSAIHDHADLLQHYRDALDELRSLASRHGLEVRDQAIWPPVPALPPAATQQQYDAWVTAWRSYRTCFDLKADIETQRVEGTHELARAMTTHTGARPEHDDGAADGRGGGHGAVGFGLDDEVDLDRRRAADRARRTLEIHEQLEATQHHLTRLREAHRAAADELHRLSRTGAPEPELTAQAREVRIAAEALRAERTTAAGLQAELAERIS